VWRRWEGRQPTGIDRVCLAYLAHFRSQAQAVVQYRRNRRIFDRESSAALFQMLAEPPADFRRALIRAGLRQIAKRSCDGTNRFYLNVGHSGLNGQGFRRWLGGARVRPIFFVHDLIPIIHPEFCRPGEQAKHQDRMRTVVGTGVGVIGNSQATVDDLLSFAHNQQLPCPPAIAAPLGCDAWPRSRREVDDGSRPTFVILGTIEARKNHLLLLHVWTRLVQRLGPSAPRLLVIGQRGWECEQVFDLLDRSELLKTAVTELGRCDDQQLAEHLANARALLFPSLVEGYGLPLVEALGSGTPVIASDLPVFREIAGDVPDYLDPLDGPAWERAILSFSENGSAARGAQMRRLAQHRPPTWEDHFEAVDSWLATL